MAENSPLTFRADEETKAKFAQICEQFANKGTALQALIGAYELETAKGTLAGSADLIEDVKTAIEKRLADGCGNLYVLVNYTALYSTHIILKNMEKG